MKELRYTLVSDGSSDRALMPVLDWLLQQQINFPIQGEWADLRRLRNPPNKLSERIRLSLALYPCDLLFIHRDAEREPLTVRMEEILQAWREIREEPQKRRPICVVPMRMLEAWLLISEKALRIAAGNPNGSIFLKMPQVKELENLPSPKKTLYELLRQASGLSGRRQERFLVPFRVHRLAELIEDFSPLRTLQAFTSLEKEVENFVKEIKAATI